MTVAANSAPKDVVSVANLIFAVVYNCLNRRMTDALPSPLLAFILRLIASSYSLGHSSHFMIAEKCTRQYSRWNQVGAKDCTGLELHAQDEGLLALNWHHVAATLVATHMHEETEITAFQGNTSLPLNRAGLLC